MWFNALPLQACRLPRPAEAMPPKLPPGPGPPSTDG